MQLVLLRHFSSFCLFDCCTCPLLCLHVYLPQMPSRLIANLFFTSPSYFCLCLSPDLPLVCLAVLVCTSEFGGLRDQLFISYVLFLFLYTFTQTDRHTLSLTQLISPSLAHSSGRMWPCLIVYHAHLFSLHDVTIAYLFSSGLPSHIKMIDSFHSLHIFKLYLISSFPLAFKSLLFPCLKVIMLPRHIIIHTLDCFFRLIICVRK